MSELSKDQFVSVKEAGVDGEGNSKWLPSDIAAIEPGNIVRVETADIEDTYISGITCTAHVETVNEKTDEDGTLVERTLLTYTDDFEDGDFYVILHHTDEFPAIDDDVDGYAASVTHVPEDDDPETVLLENIEVVE